MSHVIPTGYVYAHRSKLTNQVMYVGLSFNNIDGRYARAYDLSPRNIHHKNVIRKHGCEVEILVDQLDKSDCRIQEILAIRYYNTYEKGCNYTKGGDGIVGYKPTKEQRKHNSIMQKITWSNKTAAQRQDENLKRSKSMKKSELVRKNIDILRSQQIGANNPMYGKNSEDFMTQESVGLKRLRMSVAQKKRDRSTIITKSVTLINNGEVFKGIYEAALRYGVCRASIRRCCLLNSGTAGKHPSTKEKLIWRWT